MNGVEGSDDLLLEQVLAGAIASPDAPEHLRPLVQFVAGIRDLADREAAVTERDVTTVAAFLAAQVQPAGPGVQQPHKEKSMLAKLLTAKVAAAAAALTLSVTGAAAATGTLPDAAQDGIAEAASHIGLNLPDSASDRAREATTKHKGRPDDTGKPADAADDGDTDDTTATDAPANGANEHGEEVSRTARETDAEGREKGETVSTVARDGHGKTPPTAPTTAGAGRQDAEHRAEQSTRPTPPVTTPDDGGTDTADEASNGRSATGTAHAADPAAAGSGNAAVVPPTADDATSDATSDDTTDDTTDDKPGRSRRP